MSARPRAAVLGAVSAAAAAALLAGCTSSSPTVTGVTANPRSSATSSAGGPAPSQSGAAKGGAPGSAGGTGASGAPAPSLAAKKGATLPCNAQGLLVHLSQASGAVHGYLAKTSSTGTTVIALKSRAAAATGSKAAKFAAAQITTGVASAGGCATTAALSSVAKQTSGYLTKLSGLLAAGSASSQQVGAADALMADVSAQARRAGLKLADRVPDASLLARQ